MSRTGIHCMAWQGGWSAAQSRMAKRCVSCLSSRSSAVCFASVWSNSFSHFIQSDPRRENEVVFSWSWRPPKPCYTAHLYFSRDRSWGSPRLGLSVANPHPRAPSPLSAAGPTALLPRLGQRLPSEPAVLAGVQTVRSLPSIRRGPGGGANAEDTPATSPAARSPPSPGFSSGSLPGPAHRG